MFIDGFRNYVEQLYGDYIKRYNELSRQFDSAADVSEKASIAQEINRLNDDYDDKLRNAANGLY